MFEIVKRVVPRFLAKLSADVFPLYCQLAKSGYDFGLWTSKSPYRKLPDECGLKLALSNWAIEFHADANWLLDDALRSMRLWYVAPDEHRLLSWNNIRGRRTHLGIGDDFVFRSEGWETHGLTWSAYVRSVRQRFEKEVLDYEKRTRALAESQGLVRARIKYSPENLQWFLLYQFANMSSVGIATRLAKKERHLDETTVLKGIKMAAKLIGWHALRKPNSNSTKENSVAD
jgi:hypothetical protein